MWGMYTEVNSKEGETMQPENNGQTDLDQKTPAFTQSNTAPMPTSPTAVSPAIPSQPSPAPTPSVVVAPYTAPQLVQDQSTPTTTPLTSEAPVSTSSIPPSDRVITPNATVATPAPVASSPKGGKKWLIGLAVAVPLLLAASVAAYMGVVLPNKPENVLKMALVKTMKAENVSAKGTVDVDAGTSAAAVAFDFHSNTPKKLHSGQVDVTVSGVKVSAEMRYVDQNAYIKFGDLKTVSQLAEGYAPGSSAILQQVSGKWIEFDKTLLKQAGVACYLETPTTLSDAEIKQLNTAYDKAPFMVIKKVSGDTVEGVSAKKFEIEIDNKKAISFSQNTLAKLDSFKKLQECAKNQTDKLTNEAAKSSDKTPMTVWVGSDKKIVKLAAKVTSKNTSSAQNGALSVVMSYKDVTVEKPTGAIPAMDFAVQIQQQMQAAQTSVR